MKPFIHDDYLLQSELAKKLYRAAEHEPIIDYHCHIPPKEIAENKKFRNITEAWLGGDHYKWRAIRANGVPEDEITGDADDRVKFQRYAETMPKLIGNPLYEWSHLELKRYFNYDGILKPETADEVWELCNKELENLRALDLIKMSGVEAIVTTDDPIDTLEWHKQIAEDDTIETGVYPGWRPDKAMAIDKPGYSDYLQKLSEATDLEIDSFEQLKKALLKRLDHFADHGCTSSDHGLEYCIYAPAEAEEVEAILGKSLAGQSVSQSEADTFKYAVLLLLAEQYSKRNWVMQIHYGAYRDVNTKMFERVGADTGFDIIRGPSSAPALAGFLDDVEQRFGLPKTVVYPLSPQDFEMVGTLLNAFQSTEVPGKMQLGAAWWFNDTMSGMEHQLTAYGDLGVLGNFIGMLTDSRSFLSYTRHEYFRRLFANFIADLVNKGRYPEDMDELEKLMKNVAARNVRRYLEFPDVLED